MAIVEEAILPLGLADAVSLEDGRRLLVASLTLLSEETMAALRRAADAAASGADPAQAEDLADWAAHARALLAWRTLLKRAPASYEEFTTMVAAVGPDDRFFDVGIDMVRSMLAGYDHALGASPPEPAAAKTALEDASTRSKMLVLIADVNGQPGLRARAALATGITLMHPSFAAQGADHSRDDTALTSSRAYLEQCANEGAAPVPLRVESLQRLAWIAGPDPAEVARHQQAAEALLEATPDRDLGALRSVRRDRAWWAAQREDFAEVLRLYERNLQDSEHDLFYALAGNYATRITSGCGPDYEGAIAACLRLMGQDPRWEARAVELAEAGKARVFVHGLSLYASKRSSSAFLVNRSERIGAELRRLGSLVAGLPREAAERPRQRIEQLLDAYGENEQRRLKGGTQVRDLSLSDPRTLEEIRQLVPPGGAFVSYYWWPTRLLVSVVLEEGLAGAPVQVEIPPDDLAPDKLARAAFFLHYAIYGRGDYVAEDTLQRMAGFKIDAFWPEQFQRYLYDRLILPVADRLAGCGTLVISPHGRLRNVPFHALLAGDGSALIDHHPVAYTDGAMMLAACRGRRRTVLRTCFAAGTGAGRGGPEAASAEAAATARMFGAEPATATQVAVLGEGARADLVHLASHTDARNAISAEYGLVLEDGTLTAAEIRSARFAASMVTLSACMSGAVDVDPIVTDSAMTGLVGAFMGSGVPLVVATLWPLSDRVAQPFTARFYGSLRAGCTAAEALRDAQREIKSDSRFEHPYFWAPFALWGDATAPLSADHAEV